MEKRFIKGGVKQIDGKYGKFFKVSIDLEDFKKLKTVNGYVHFIISERKEPDKYGNTHYMYWDDYVRENKESNKENNEENKKNIHNEDSTNDLPF